MEEKIEPHEELAELLNGEPPEDLNNPPVEPSKEEKGEAPEASEAKADEPEGEPEKPEEVPPTSDDVRFRAMIAKSQDEVSKRQAMESELAQMKQQLDQATRQPEPQIDPLDNPDGYRQQLETVLRQQQHQHESNRTQDRIAMSEMVVKMNVGAEKYDEATKVFSDAARLNPALIQAMNQSEVPAKFAYDEGQRILFMKKIGDDPDAYEANIEAQVRKKIEAENASAASAAQRQETIDALPKTIANAGTSAPLGSELPDDSLEALLNS